MWVLQKIAFRERLGRYLFEIAATVRDTRKIEIYNLCKYCFGANHFSNVRGRVLFYL